MLIYWCFVYQKAKESLWMSIVRDTALSNRIQRFKDKFSKILTVEPPLQKQIDFIFCHGVLLKNI